MALNVPGTISVALFYLAVLSIGIWASWKEKKRGGNTTESVVLAGRNIGLVLGILTMTATWCGGSIVNAASEIIYTDGFLWCQAPFAFSLSLFFGGMFFAKRMRERGYVTMLDPLQQKYGSTIGSILFLPTLVSDVVWMAAILSALGTTLSVILDIDSVITIVSSATVIVIYTFLGGMYSVAFTDVIQLICIVVGLTLCVPFAWTHPAVNHETLFAKEWLGTIEPTKYYSYIDNYLLMILGGIPYQAYFQRVLAMKTARDAQLISYIATFLCPIMAIPAILMGGIARSTDWANGTDYGLNITSSDQTKQILPLVLQYLTPPWVSFFGLGAISAAIMSTADSCILSCSTLFTLNIYKAIFRPRASDLHVTIVMRITILGISVLGTWMALSLKSLYGTAILCSDLLYALLFPQLVLILYWDEYCNKYGCLMSFFIGTLLRCLCGESSLYLPAVIELPLYSDGQQLFPFRTAIMLICLFTHMIFSWLSLKLFTSGWLDIKYDFLHCFTPDAQQPTSGVNIPLTISSGKSDEPVPKQ